MALSDDIARIGARLEHLLDERDERTEDIKELRLEAKSLQLPMKAIEEIVAAKRKDKVGKKRDHITDLLTIAPSLGVDLGMSPESASENARSGASLKSVEFAAALGAVVGLNGTLQVIRESREAAE